VSKDARRSVGSVIVGSTKIFSVANVDSSFALAVESVDAISLRERGRLLRSA